MTNRPTQRISNKENKKVVNEAITFPILDLEHQLKELRLVKGLFRVLYNKRFKLYIATPRKSFPRYYSHQFYKTSKNENDFNLILEDLKNYLMQNEFSPSALDFNLFRHKQLPSIYVYVKKYPNANSAGVYLMKYYESNEPQLLDLL